MYKKEGKEYYNNFFVQGKIMDVYSNPYMVILTIITGDTRNSRDYPQIQFLGKMIEEAMQYSKGDKVMIKGRMLSYRDKEDRRRWRQGYLGTEISPAISNLYSMTGKIGKNIIENKNQFAVSGDILGMQKVAENIVLINIMTYRWNEKKNLEDHARISLSCYAENANSFINGHKEDTFLTAAGRIWTSNKTIKGERRHFIDAVISDVCWDTR